MSGDAPVLAVTQRVLRDPGHGELRTALDVRWPRFLRECGFLAVPMPLDSALAVEVLHRTGCRGLVLTGGDDLGSVPERDALERQLFRLALEHGRPVVGVCRGMQLIVDLFGGSLRQVPGHVAQTHVLTGPYGGRRVNSYHTWAALDGPPHFDVTARCGPVVEAIVHRSEPIAGIMWHPERADPADPEDVALFTRIFGEVSCVP
ncbi:gamma-glutamyl-gamma-aminobutyrate hydrolase family protein [Amycolatopsis acidiphila]|uniref:Uncharacterized protein n=1 Tax=Amycolatopsis acidiphila TaxID=715473 RepID=A0A557ZPY6_9PSEU|nr:gamma-glutamyl-gamma-aminobutyrate hydrolase family protein [Amycolatopsis acidiphila]TVT14050.1 hypothetical protein FNH06_38220 [Amycolatopsis acidiphila]UIJ63606.1 gamma-glutamyl-gamma-aminobutyrate hydrolase family protein [Amycolatopsis acidiphila]GHG67971.1 glutamine amidotransferase [Amycolatopsis acidiphila]